ncbi:MAG: hypothetical protein ACI39G_06615 [Pseudoramibacter sp.]
MERQMPRRFCRFTFAAAVLAALTLLFVMLPVHAEGAPVITDVQMYQNGKALNLNTGDAVKLTAGSTLSMKVFGEDGQNDTADFTWKWVKGKNTNASPVSTDARYTVPKSDTGDQTYTVIYGDTRDGSEYTCTVTAKVSAKSSAGAKKASRIKIASASFSLSHLAIR